ncbi:hypothetical protein HS088_TW17G00318 [Tripterygium wilfordii]|uniref:Uncharacterized protein n=1 Tax=Tripterygium wilfordii TaxID=458696 RepID=A0A7J7CG24_TRIWF|nr:hypothetical protein HS088_TW17G00318 [Tripterygium wilfordii]
MNGYSTCCQVSLQKSRSTEFSEFYTPLHETKPILSHNSKNPDRKPIQNNQNNVRNSEPEEEDNEDGEIFGVILSRISSVKSTCCHVEKEKSLAGGAVGRVFSMRSLSVGEGYSRIHYSDDGEEQSTLHKRRSRRKKGHFLRRLFGF